jgi:hypothetical protein
MKMISAAAALSLLLTVHVPAAGNEYRGTGTPVRIYRYTTAVNVKPLFTTPKDVLSNFAIHKASFQMQPLSKNQSYSN